MDSVDSQIHGVFTKLLQLQSIDLHHQIKGGALGLLGETHPYLGVDVGHDHLAVLVRQGDAQLVVALFDPVKAHPGDHGAVGDGVGGLRCGNRVEGSQDADLAAVVHGRVAEGKDFQFQHGKHGRAFSRGKDRPELGLQIFLPQAPEGPAIRAPGIGLRFTVRRSYEGYALM